MKKTTIKTKYTRISISKNLDNVISQVQKELPLYTINDVINFLINTGYKSWKEKDVKSKNLKQKNFLKYKAITFNKTKSNVSSKFTGNKEMYQDYYLEKYGK